MMEPWEVEEKGKALALPQCRTRVIHVGVRNWECCHWLLHHTLQTRFRRISALTLRSRSIGVESPGEFPTGAMPRQSRTSKAISHLI